MYIVLQIESVMTPDRWRRIEELYHAASPLSVEVRDEYLAEHCGSDADLIQAVSSLLAQSSEGAPILDEQIWTAPYEKSQVESESANFGPYKLISQLGAGGMGVVYLAEDTRLHRKVAIKISRGRYSERFEHEARAIAALNHPCICTLYDVGPTTLSWSCWRAKPSATGCGVEN